MADSTPAKAEARGESVAFEYDGDSYVVPPPMEWDVDVLEAYEDGKVATTVRALLGASQWAKFRSKPRTVQSLNDLFVSLQTAMGLEGN
ncbi:hypothetical protein [Actinopolymorpha pittospori]|uniref:Tail assembly chaperone n=1 Tax=Actinopolymorpha pittospori TaxID=648752 RepID=A0A927R990_9ACTN|nr:hypothetical protein [Actinopolymorpha pittospori]MBE1606244.1 hypothetical protein [Actinopolymorpha pittospori]